MYRIIIFLSLLIVLSNSINVERCRDHQILYQNSCVDKCFGKFHDGSKCVDKCPNGKKLISGMFCVSSCPAHAPNVSDNQCVCKNSSLFNNGIQCSSCNFINTYVRNNAEAKYKYKKQCLYSCPESKNLLSGLAGICR